MKKFIKNTIIFILIFFVMVVMFDLIISKILQSASNLKIISQPQFVVFGHSQSECAYNDSLISHFCNLSESGESYFYTYYKAKIILEQNPDINSVFIEFANDQISDKMNEWIWGDKYMTAKYPKYSPFIDKKEKLFLLSKNIPGFINSLSISFKINTYKIINGNYKYIKEWGGYQFLVRDKTDSIVNVLLSKGALTKILPLSNDPSQYNLKFLRRLVDLCHDKGKIVYLIRSPLHEKYPGCDYEMEYQAILKDQFSDVEFIDFCRFPLNNNEFGDLQHLNYKGAKVYSIWFDHLLDMGLLSKINKQDFINYEINSLRQQRLVFN